jgi:Zn-dependent oligopeptidase
VKESVFSAATEMFGIRFRPAAATVWHPSVEAYDVLGHDQLIGRIYLDMFPRGGKYQHFATFGIRPGETGKQLPEGSLLCNFTAPNG